jgi:uncharacterized protein (TIGR03086 family)
VIDLAPAAARMAALLTNVTDEQLGAATPCPDLTAGDLADHVGTMARAFAAKASGQPGTGPPPPPSAANLEAGWRDRIGRDLDALAAAWRDPAAWDGMTVAGGIEMPSAIGGLVVLDELVVHGWDIAVATDQSYTPPADEIASAIEFASTFDAPRDGGLFGPVVAVPADASALDRLLGLTGRDPGWARPDR